MQSLLKIKILLFLLIVPVTSTAQFKCTCSADACGNEYAEGRTGQVVSSPAGGALEQYLDQDSRQRFLANNLAWSKESGWLCSGTHKPWEGWFDVITYNIHGNYGHGGISGDEKAELGRVLQNFMSEGKSILVLQEDWRYNFVTTVINTLGDTCDGPERTRENITLAYKSKSFNEQNECDSFWSDGLNMFSSFRFDPEVYRRTYSDRVDAGAAKGFSIADVSISNDFNLHVYNTHTGRYEIREKQFRQLTDQLNFCSNNQAAVLAGDTNLIWMEKHRDKYENSGPGDWLTFNNLLKENGLQSACLAMGTCDSILPGDEEIIWPYEEGVMLDQIFFKGSDRISLEVSGFEQLDLPHSDHKPILARFIWKSKPAPADCASKFDFEGSPTIFPNEYEGNAQYIYTVTTDGRLTERKSSHTCLTFPAEEAGYDNLRFESDLVVLPLDEENLRKAIYAVTTDGQLVQLWQTHKWELDFPAENAGYGKMKFLPGIAAFPRLDDRNKKFIYAVNVKQELVQLWDTNKWNLDFPAKKAGHPDIKFNPGVTAYSRDVNGTKKFIFAVTTNGKLVQIWDTNKWNLEFIANNIHLQPGLTVYPRTTDKAKKFIFGVTTGGELVQIWDTNRWNLDFPANDYKFQPGLAVYPRTADRSKKYIFGITTSGKLAQIWDTNKWNLDFPAKNANYGGQEFKPGVAIAVRNKELTKKVIYAVTTTGQLRVMWDTDRWNTCP